MIDPTQLGKGAKGGAPTQLSAPAAGKPGKYPKTKMSPFEKAERKRATTEQKKGIRSFGLGSDFNEAPTQPKQSEKQEIDFEDFWDDNYDWTATTLHKDKAENSQPMDPDIYYEPAGADLDLAARIAHREKHDHFDTFDAKPIDLTEHDEHDLTKGDSYFSKHSAERYEAYDLIHQMPVAEEKALAHHHSPVGKSSSQHSDAGHHLDELRKRQLALAMQETDYDVPGGELDFDSDDDHQSYPIRAAEEEIKNSLLRMLL